MKKLKEDSVIKDGKKYRKLDRDDVIKEGAMHSWAGGG